MVKYHQLWQGITRNIDSVANISNNHYNYYYRYLIKRDNNYHIFESKHLLINYVYNKVLENNPTVPMINNVGLLFGKINVVKHRQQYYLIMHANHYKSYYEIIHSSEIYLNGDKSLNALDKAIKLILNPKSKLIKISKYTGISYDIIQQYQSNPDLLGHASWLNISLLSQVYNQHIFEN